MTPGSGSRASPLKSVEKRKPHQGAVHMHITTIGLDIAKNMFQVHGIDAAEKVVIRKQLRRGQVLKFFAALPPYHTGDRQKAPKIAPFPRLRTTSVLCPIRQQDASSITHRCPSAQLC